MRKHLTDVVAEKTVLLEKCQKECLDAKKRAEQSDRISHILSKDNEKLKFELNRWKLDAERNITEISRLKEELRKLTSTVPPNSTYAPQSRIEPQTPKDSPHTTGSLVSHSVSQSPISQSPAYTDPNGENYQECMQFVRSERQSCNKAFECYVSGFTATDPLCWGDNKILTCRRGKKWASKEYDGSMWFQPVLRAHTPRPSEENFVSCLLESLMVLEISPISRIAAAEPPAPVQSTQSMKFLAAAADSPAPLQSTQKEEENDGFYDNVYHRLHKRNKENMVMYALLIAIVISLLILLLHTQNSN
ncbi:unnamed protein product [Cylicocyclus nassatus]|uniref:Uncharacterized protein n=1 Tax=Cylicocyclus nassatus TaxID=53992 RepID=A0AA36GP51_CYLNA|nr:unnamed protein product [Cylicocyclus nassatus]